MVQQYQDRGKVGQMLLLDLKREATTDREKQKCIHFVVLLSHLSLSSMKNINDDPKNMKKWLKLTPNLWIKPKMFVLAAIFYETNCSENLRFLTQIL